MDCELLRCYRSPLFVWLAALVGALPLVAGCGEYDTIIDVIVVDAGKPSLSDVSIDVEPWTTRQLEIMQGCEYKVSIKLSHSESNSLQSVQELRLGETIYTREYYKISVKTSVSDPDGGCAVKQLQCRIKENVGNEENIDTRAHLVACDVPIFFAAPYARGLGDGSSWENAGSLEDAAYFAKEIGPEHFKAIWLELGDYNEPVESELEDSIFALNARTLIYGGFSGEEFLLVDREADFVADAWMTGDVSTDLNDAF